jgi:hypothetical protein
MSIAEQITKSAQNLSNARKAILLKGGNVGDNPAFNNLASEIESIPSGDVNYVLVEDTDTAYRKSILNGAYSLAKLKSIGGMTYKRFKEDDNLLPYPYISANDMQGTFTVSQDSFADDWNMEITATLVDSTNSFTLPAGTYIFNFNASIITDIDDVSPAGWVTINDVTKDVYADENATFTFDTDTLVTNISVCYEWQMNVSPDLPATGSISPLLVDESDYNVFFKPRCFELVDTVVEKVVSYGANLFDIYRTDFAAVNIYAMDYKPKVENGIFYSGGKLDESQGATIPIYLEPNTDYTFSCNVSSNDANIYLLALLIKDFDGYLYNPDEAQTILVVRNNGNATVTFNSREYTAFGFVAYSTNRYGMEITDIQLNLGTTVAEYKPYREPITYEIPEALQGSGKGVEGYADTVDFERGKQIQKCKTAVLNGSETWFIFPNTSIFYTLALTDAKYAENVYCVADKFNGAVSGGGTAHGIGDCWFQAQTTYPRFYIGLPADITTEQAARDYLASNPVTVTYALAEPVETDLPESGAIAIEVEGGGEAEFFNADKRAVPSHISYLRRIV